MAIIFSQEFVILRIYNIIYIYCIHSSIYNHHNNLVSLKQHGFHSHLKQHLIQRILNGGHEIMKCVQDIIFFYLFICFLSDFQNNVDAFVKSVYFSVMKLCPRVKGQADRVLRCYTHSSLYVHSVTPFYSESFLLSLFIQAQ